jgi:MFS family permease
VTTRAASVEPPASNPAAKRGYNLFLLLVAGLGGLLYGIDVGIIGGALPYLEATSHLNAAQLSSIVAAVLLGSVFSTLFAGILADSLGRRGLMILSGVAFVVSIPVIALSSGYWMLFYGRLLQGISAGLVGVVVPLYLAECLSAENRGKGTGIFQWMLTLGIVAAALVGMFYSYRVQAMQVLGNTTEILNYKDHVWRQIFWVSLPPGLFFVIGSLLVSESPRWLFRRGRKEAALKALLRSRPAEQAQLELREMEAAAQVKPSAGQAVRDSIVQRKYLVPFLLACAILSCNTATGVNSVIGFNTGILLQSGLSDLAAHWGYVFLTAVNFIMTMVGTLLVDRKGRRFLMIFGTVGIIVSMIAVGTLFHTTEKQSVDARAAVQAMVTPDQQLTLQYSPEMARKLLASAGGATSDPAHTTLSIIYSYGDYTAATSSVRADDAAAAPLEMTRASAVPANHIHSIFKNPFADLNGAQTAPLRIQKAVIGQLPPAAHGWLVAALLYLFMAFYAVGPGVCVWLALSELMPTRIRSNGMSVALVLNQLVSTTLAGIFLPFVANYGYARIFFLFAGFTTVYFLVVTLFLPETKGKTLEEIEAHFEGNAAH